MSYREPPIPIKTGRYEDVFPVLTSAQLEQVQSYGKSRSVQPGEVLTEQGEVDASFFAVVSGELESVRPAAAGEQIVAVIGPGQFMGEVNNLSGRRAMFRVRVSQRGEVIQLDRDALLHLVQTDEALGEILMSAFLLRRASLVAAGVGDVLLVGSEHSADTLKIKEFLMRNGEPYAYIDLERDAEVEDVLKHFQIEAHEVPVVICEDRAVLKNPTNQELSRCLGFNAMVDESRVRDLVVIGAGPGGLAAAVYGASEGLDVLLLEATSPGGQAASSSRIENYLGFPTGVSGQELAARAYSQAEKFGAQMLLGTGSKLFCNQTPQLIETDGGVQISSRCVVIATGAEYRKLPIANLARFEGVGIYYSATYVESQLCADEEVIVVGGGNSAGQAAVFLAQTAKRVYVVIRAADLAASMSRYLARRIEEIPNIVLTPHTEIIALEGGDHLESVRWRNNQTGDVEEHAIRQLFLMLGGVPNTGWLDRCVALDPNGFVRTGPELSPEDLHAASWPLARPPFLLETSLPRVFAVGDVRSRSVKRVASAVGEGSIAISFVHQALQE